MKLRGYQEHALDDLRDAVRELRAAAPAKPARVVLVLPTGAGKTAVGVELCRRVTAHGRRVVIAVGLSEIHAQWVERLTSAGVQCGWITADESVGLDRPVVVAMVGTLIARGDCPDGHYVIVDECHHTASDTWSRLVRAYVDAEVVVGLSATPQRADGKGLAAYFDRLVIGAAVDDLVRERYLLDVKVVAPSAPQSALAMTPTEAFERHCRGRRTLFFAANVAHSRETVAAMTARGIRAEHVDGDVAPAERQAIMARFRGGEIDVLCNSSLLGEGVDAPGTSAVIIARGTESEALWRQMIGRAMRPAAGIAVDGEHAVVVDLRGAIWACGHPCEPIEMSLGGGLRLKAEAERLPCRACKSCGGVSRGGAVACESCGAKFPPARRPKVKAAPMDVVERARVAKEWASMTSHFFALCKQAFATGHGAAWVDERFQARWGRYVPRRFWDTWRRRNETKAAVTRCVTGESE